MKITSDGERPDIMVTTFESFSKVDLSTVCRYVFSFNYIKNKNSLDVGCGFGHGVFLQSLYAKSAKGFDISKKAVDIGNRFLASKGLSNNNLTCYFPTHNKYDVITAFEVIEHIEKDGGLNLLKELKRSLSRKGVLIISTPYIDFRGKTYWKFHKHEYYGPELKKILSRNFKYVRAFYQYGNGQNISSSFIKSFLGNLTTSNSTLIFVCSDFKDTVLDIDTVNEGRGFTYKLVRGLYRNLKYLVLGK